MRAHLSVLALEPARIHTHHKLITSKKTANSLWNGIGLGLKLVVTVHLFVTLLKDDLLLQRCKYLTVKLSIVVVPLIILTQGPELFRRASTWVASGEDARRLAKTCGMRSSTLS